MKKKYLYAIIAFLVITYAITVKYIFCRNAYISSDDFEVLKNLLTITKDVVLILAPIITIIIAINGINKWKNEFRGKANFEASYKLLKSIYQIRDNFASARASFIMASEMLPDLNIKDYNIENERHVLKKRATPLHESYNNFNSILPEIEALFGKDIKELCLGINKIMFKYHMSVNEYLQLYGKTNNTEHFEKVTNRVFSQTDDDELKNELDIIITKLETELSKHIKMM